MFAQGSSEAPNRSSARCVMSKGCVEQAGEDAEAGAPVPSDSEASAPVRRDSSEAAPDASEQISDDASRNSHWPRPALIAGVTAAIATPGVYILIFAMLGFGALARDLGFSAFEAAAITALVFQLPGQVALVDEAARGATGAVIAIAVVLTAIRLLPMSAVLMPYLRGSSAPWWAEMLATHFVAITSWVEALRRLPERPSADRLPFFVGFGATVCAASTVATLVGHLALAALPPLVAAVLLFLMPVYFITSLISTAVAFDDRAALVIGTVLGPLFFLLAPGLDLLLTGLLGGTLAWWIGRRSREAS